MYSNWNRSRSGRPAHHVQARNEQAQADARQKVAGHNKTPRSVYLEDFKAPEPWLLPEEPKNVMIAEGESHGQGTASHEGSELHEPGFHGGEAHSEPKRIAVLPGEPAKREPSHRMEARIVQTADESSFVPQQAAAAAVSALSAETALQGIVLAEILGPPKGRAYFLNRRR